MNDQIKADDLQQLLDEQVPTMLLDMRDTQAYCQEHDPRAIHLSELTLGTLLRSIPPHLRIVICCADGSKSPQMVELFQDFGFLDCQDLEGGYAAWRSRPTRTARFRSALAGRSAEQALSLGV